MIWTFIQFIAIAIYTLIIFGAFFGLAVALVYTVGQMLWRIFVWLFFGKKPFQDDHRIN